MAEEAGRVERALERALGHLEPRVGSDLAAAIRHGVLSGGKRLRPILCVAAYSACGGTRASAAYDLGASVELIHAYSLIHDDLPCMDDAELRRGRATTHREHGEAAAIGAGVILIPAAAPVASQTDPAVRSPKKATASRWAAPIRGTGWSASQAYVPWMS